MKDYELRSAWARGVIIVDDEAYNECERALSRPVKPSKSILAGAELLRRLYGPKVDAELLRAAAIRKGEA